MKKLTCFTLVFVLVASLVFVVGGHMTGDNPFEASAQLSRLEAELCLELNTYLSPHPQAGHVDIFGYLNCLMFLNDDTPD